MDVNNKKTNILLIGCTGFLGGRLVELLVKNDQYNVTIISNSFSGNGLARAAKFPLKIISANMLDIDSLDKAMMHMDVVINGAYLKGGKTAIKSSVNGTKNIVHSALKNKIKQIIQISSAAVFEPDNNEIKDESSSFINKPDDYVKTKLLTEKVVSKMLDSKLNKETKFTIIRPTRIYGPYSGYWTERILEGLKQSKKVLIDEYKYHPSNFVYVDDVCNAIISSIMNGKAFGNDYNINGEKDLSWKKLLDGFQTIVDPSNIVQVTPYDVIVSINKDKVKNLFPNSINALKQALLSNESLDIFRNDLLLSSLYRNLYGKHRKSDQSISYEPKKQSINLEDYSFLDKFFVKDMLAKTYISAEKIKRDLSFEIQFPFEKAVEEVRSWYLFFDRQKEVIDDMYKR